MSTLLRGSCYRKLAAAMRCVVNVGYAESEAVGTRRASRFDACASVSPTFGVGCGIFQ
ncbi:hypothetical protein JI435_412170 [Parastagonospora nodorum SN15]|uniref:Uncharacterized protein n=1 Tax=Phaeosphaeria nodorum (strain SN15 / ATCC MYA-4574 / FGSC 10173) TaxID=321614 RepID=A0A7U2F4F5_PHANO|nr:hypothetical protein HBI08_038410 [Parastagonospora nodorum]QRC98492.1 hypothetical protein JI435_412170 [Parastagonospora nodorum SN15]